MVAGLLPMPTRIFFLPGLVLFAISAGTLKGNLSIVVETLFRDDAARRRGFAFHLGFLNTGVIYGPFLCGALAVLGGWRWSMMAAAVAVLIRLLGSHLAVRRMPATGPLPPAPPPLPPPPAAADVPTSAGARNLVRVTEALLAVFLCFGAYEQIGNIFLVCARTQVALEAFGSRLGELVGDDLGLIPRLEEVLGTLKVPQWWVQGNHDYD
ncbi:dipeptide/tripeptide permease [Sphingomonas zeicaulis]